MLVGVVATIGKDFVAYWIGRRNSGRYAAVRIVCILDQFAEKCVDVAGDDGTAEGRPAGRTASGEEYYEAQVDPPEPPVFPDDIDWTGEPKRVEKWFADLRKADKAKRRLSLLTEADPPLVLSEDVGVGPAVDLEPADQLAAGHGGAIERGG